MNYPPIDDDTGVSDKASGGYPSVMPIPRNRRVKVSMITLGIVLGAGGIWLSEVDDAPGAALLGFVLMSALIFAALRPGG